MGFSAFGKHARNITPIMLGVVIGGVFMHFDINQSSVQLALLFGTGPYLGLFRLALRHRGGVPPLLRGAPRRNPGGGH